MGVIWREESDEGGGESIVSNKNRYINHGVDVEDEKTIVGNSYTMIMDGIFCVLKWLIGMF